ncbi:hypothetical protein A3A67_02945 [Candidatus Peribacteria bacterium RIFCSPLOWO2_01_FULL_51_18]|nr:MAG: hypothetical protein A3C52_00805 [Candidatus Peribacteria bacterium RIFCSPHIGHO2_02_FULL_51_15]OGJ66004.1 MAG: hypothetical protein A3A67_02945 [Candidatus Peribacteria bacterium RIFCSPLOWO2_01_FULL_51_18]OGJ69210.1 MAG: hypothetical protein A3J34_01440 [Candidatus Peribacteria bacterium RIFCSPLOWO2_02_FULL_51_10]
MDSLIATAGFWIVFGLACAWLLPRYYYARDEKRANELRYAAIIIDTLVLLSLVLPWIPFSRGGPASGVTLFMRGDPLFSIFAFSAFAALALLSVGNKSIILKIAACLQILGSVFLFAAMLRLLPGTFTMTFDETAPIFAAILMLCGCVAVLLLWQQLQKRKR